MRRYLQGTLDFACGIYAVINALSLTHGLDLSGARAIFRETHLDVAARPALWADYSANTTDHYWLVRHTLERWCSTPPYRLAVHCPFGPELWTEKSDLDRADRYLPERLPPQGPAKSAEAESEALRTFEACRDWLAARNSPGRALILRFHRFIPGVRTPIVSHWTTGKSMENGVLHLHDASSEPRALMSLSKDLLMPFDGRRAPVRIVPESLLLLEKA